MAKVWKKIDDLKVRNIWVKAKDDDCEYSPEEVECSVGPDWYAENGTPMCPCGEDLEYSYTEIEVEEW